MHTNYLAHALHTSQHYNLQCVHYHGQVHLYASILTNKLLNDAIHPLTCIWDFFTAKISTQSQHYPSPSTGNTRITFQPPLKDFSNCKLVIHTGSFHTQIEGEAKFTRIRSGCWWKALHDQIMQVNETRLALKHCTKGTQRRLSHMCILNYLACMCKCLKLTGLLKVGFHFCHFCFWSSLYNWVWEGTKHHKQCSEDAPE